MLVSRDLHNLRLSLFRRRLDRNMEGVNKVEVVVTSTVFHLLAVHPSRVLNPDFSLSQQLRGVPRAKASVSKVRLSTPPPPPQCTCLV